METAPEDLCLRLLDAAAHNLQKCDGYDIRRVPQGARPLVDGQHRDVKVRKTLVPPETVRGGRLEFILGYSDVLLVETPVDCCAGDGIERDEDSGMLFSDNSQMFRTRIAFVCT